MTKKCLFSRCSWALRSRTNWIYQRHRTIHRGFRKYLHWQGKSSKNPLYFKKKKKSQKTKNKKTKIRDYTETKRKRKSKIDT